MNSKEELLKGLEKKINEYHERIANVININFWSERDGEKINIKEQKFLQSNEISPSKVFDRIKERYKEIICYEKGKNLLPIVLRYTRTAKEWLEKNDSSKAKYSEGGLFIHSPKRVESDLEIKLFRVDYFLNISQLYLDLLTYINNVDYSRKVSYKLIEEKIKGGNNIRETLIKVVRGGVVDSIELLKKVDKLYKDYSTGNNKIDEEEVKNIPRYIELLLKSTYNFYYELSKPLLTRSVLSGPISIITKDYKEEQIKELVEKVYSLKSQRAKIYPEKAISIDEPEIYIVRVIEDLYENLNRITEEGMVESIKNNIENYWEIAGYKPSQKFRENILGGIELMKRVYEEKFKVIAQLMSSREKGSDKKNVDEIYKKMFGEWKN